MKIIRFERIKERGEKIMTSWVSKIVVFSILILSISYIYNNFYANPRFVIPPAYTKFTDKDTPARLAYYIAGSTGDVQRLKRLLLAAYHPYNIYIVFLDKGTSRAEHQELSYYIESHALYSAVGNIKIIVEKEEVNMTKIVNVLHVAAVLLKDYEWDWFIKLDAFDYPLVNQDDLLFVLSRMPRHLNFINHANDLSGRLNDSREIVMQKLHYQAEYFHLFTGSPLMVLTRSFIEYCLSNEEKLPKHVLFMYDHNDQAESKYSEESYFQTVICNSREFANNTVNTDLHFIIQDDSSPCYIMEEDGRLISIVRSYAAFARKFNEENSYLLDWIDKKLLFRHPNMLVPGGWCAGLGRGGKDPCLIVGNMTPIDYGPGTIRLVIFFEKHLHNNGTVSSPQCVLNGSERETVKVGLLPSVVWGDVSL